VEDHASTADSFAVSCIGLGWVHIFRFGLGRVTRNGPTDNSGRQGVEAKNVVFLEKVILFDSH